MHFGCCRLRVYCVDLLYFQLAQVCVHTRTGVATMGPRGAMVPSLLSCFSAVSISWFTFAIASICCGPLTCLLLATPLHTRCMFWVHRLYWQLHSFYLVTHLHGIQSVILLKCSSSCDYHSSHQCCSGGW